MAMFNSYVKVPEGSRYHFNLNNRVAKANIHMSLVPYFLCVAAPQPSLGSWNRDAKGHPRDTGWGLTNLVGMQMERNWS